MYTADKISADDFCIYLIPSTSSHSFRETQDRKNTVHNARVFFFCIDIIIFLNSIFLPKLKLLSPASSEDSSFFASKHLCIFISN